ncbi:Protein RST1 [Rhynchospora pubera]|uniref:Protein RST1 n=1 Tax=Rhynchospora pubera TaxID=906938 RepID=A0AAV8DF65_9POAL|nr:Protein RST1 [Rhynchospora pubera]
MEPSSTWSHNVDPARLPDPSLQRQSISSLFNKLRLSPSSSSPLPDSISLSLNSTSLAAADQATRELCRLVSASLVTPSDALLELQSALDGCSSGAGARLGLAPVFVKGIGFVVRFLFKTDSSWGRSGFDPVELHPFVKVLLCGEHVEMELIRQVSLFIVHNKTGGVKEVGRFLKPILMFSVLRKSSLVFARDLISSVATIACSLKEEALLSLLIGCLKYFPRENGKELKLLLSLAECLVDAYAVILRQYNIQATMSKAQTCCVELLEIFLPLCYVQGKPFGVTETILQLVKRLLSMQKEHNLKLSPEFNSVFISISYVLSQAEFEHDQLAGLKLLLFLTEWRFQSDLNSSGPTCLLKEELLCIFPVVNMLMSPSNSVKAMASRFLSMVNGLILDLISAHSSEENACSSWTPVDPHSSVLLRLLNYLMFEVQSSSGNFFYLELITRDGGLGQQEMCQEEKHWAFLFREYLSRSCQQESTHNVIQPGISGLLSSVATLLITHATLGPSAVETLAKLGATDPKLAVPVLLSVLFYIRIFSSNVNDTPQMVLRLMESLAPVSSHNFMVPIVLQTILPMLKSEAKPMLYATAVRLLCKMWISSDRVFANLQKVLDVEGHSGIVPEKDIAISIAASVRDVCKNNPDRGVDLILPVSSCIESRASMVQALGLEGLAYLCEADVVDFYTAWAVISKHVFDYSTDSGLAYGLAKLLEWGSMDADAYPDVSANIVQILWDIATKKNMYHDSSWVEARVAAFNSLSHYKVVHVQQAIPDFKRRNFECFISENNQTVLNAMEELEVEIIRFEHTSRKRGLKVTRHTVSKADKLLHVFPEVVFTRDKKRYCELPGAALICLDFTPKDESRHGIMKDLHRVHAAYETALLELAESLHVPRNLAVAVLVLQSWKVFLDQWISAVVNSINAQNISSDLSEKNRKAANDIFKILCKVAVESVPAAAVNIALAIGALCLVIPASEHFVVSNASEFLFNWLYEYGHEHKQWSAAISLGLVTSCFHPTDNQSKYKIINGLLKVLQTTESSLVRGACGIGLGYASKCIFRGVQENITSVKSEETKLLETIITTLCAFLSKQYPSTVSSFQALLTEAVPSAPQLILEVCDFSTEDPWGIAGLVLGLGISIFALYRTEAHKAVIILKNLLVSWVADLSFDEITKITKVPLSIGSCLALPMVISFCHRVELSREDDLDSLFNHYYLLISELIQMKKSNGIYTDLLMAASMGAGSLISNFATDGVYSLRLDVVKDLLQTIGNVYTKAGPPLVHLGGLIGTVNAFGASAGNLDQSTTQHISFLTNAPKELTSLIRGPLLSNPSCESLCTSTIQEIFLLAKDMQDPQRKHYAAWALSFLRNQWLSRDLSDKDSSSNQNLSEGTLGWDLCSWLRDLGSSQTETLPQKEILATVLRCLTKAPRLPSFDWASIIRRCMKFEEPGSHKSTPSLREECLNFSLVHASNISTLLHFLDDLTDLPRFMHLESQLQALLLENLSTLLRLFSGSRLEKLFGDLMQFFSLESSSILRRSFWKGLCNYFGENSMKVEGSSLMHLGKCMECLLSHLPGFNGDSQITVFEHELSDATKCLSLTPQSWLIDLLKVTAAGPSSAESNFDEGKRIVIVARLVNSGSLPVSELGKMKAYVLNAKSESSWWNVLLEVTTAISISDNMVKRQWLLDALEVSCVAEYPLMTLRFVGLLCGLNCAYMPLLIVDPRSVIADLPLTLPALLSDPNWWSVRSSVAEKLWSSANRVRTWAEHLFNGLGLMDGSGIKETDGEMGLLLVRVMHETCVVLKEHLPFDKQLKLATSEVL